ncbi:unnamed protein product [Staurois parvus]|uniref:Uncharacterized protein n=1 Tax=Staurois parvus TaxID=386267 RepID=A0ABN9DLA8_9NEOB|nr:unnamed protein product [Staurois parvus]
MTKRLQRVQEMTRDCGQYRGGPETADSTGDDQRLRTVQGMTNETVDLWGGRGSGVGTG